ncbi:MAG: macro domain-containing protein [Ignavibacteria bacterium]
MDIKFSTKDHWRSPSKLDYIESGLIKFSNEYKSKGIKSIAFPKLGTQNGGLDWEDVKILMYEYLSPLKDLDVEIYHYFPETKIKRINYYEEVI